MLILLKLNHKIHNDDQANNENDYYLINSIATHFGYIVLNFIKIGVLFNYEIEGKKQRFLSTT